MATKKTSSRTKSKSAAATERERKKRELHSRQQFWAIVVFAVAVFIMATTLVEGQNVWNWIHNFFLGMFGWSAYLIAPLLFYVSIMTALDKPIGLVGHKVWQSMLLICLLSGATQVFGSGIPNGNLIEKFLSLFQNGVDGHGGGAVSGLFGLPLLYWFGPTGAKVTMVLLIFVVLMVLTGGTLIGLYQSAKKPMQKMEEVYVAHSEIRNQQRQLRQEQMMEEGQAPTKPHFNINIPLGSGKRAEQEDGLQTDSFFNAKRKKEEELERLRQAQEDTEKGRAAMREKLELERAEQKRQEQQRAEQIAAERRELEQSVESDSFWNPPEEPMDEQESQLSSPYLDDLINRVAPAAGSGYAREDQAVLHTLKSNMPNAGVRPVVDSADLDHPSHLHEERMGDHCQTGLSWEQTEPLLEEEDIADGFISMQNFHFGQQVQEDAEESEMDEIFQPAAPQGMPIVEEEEPVFFQPQEEPQEEEPVQFRPDNIHLEPEPPTGSRREQTHEIIQVSADRIAAEGMDLQGASHSVDAPQPEEEEPEYIKPPIEILNEIEKPNESNLQEELRTNAEKLVSTLQSFGVQTRIIDIARGPAVTRYELQPSAGVKISKITNLADDIALNLAASGVRIEAPIPNKPAVGIEVPNKVVSTVSIREIIDSPEFQQAKSPLAVALGRDIAGKVTVADLAKMPHTLIAGSTGSGKSVCINSLIVSMLYHSTPQEVKLLLIDPKMVELGIYNGIPHLLIPVVTDPKKAAGALSWAVNEMLNRYQLFKDYSVRDMTGFNRAAEKNGLKPMPQIVIIIDELADLMMAAPGEVEDSICRLAQMARAAGMHLVIATQRPSVDVITGVIKANIPSRIAFAVSSQIDSRTILDSSGAEKLLGRGDMLFSPIGSSKPTRVQGCFVTDGEVERIIEFIKQSGQKMTYDEQILQEIDRHAVSDNKKKGGKDEGGGFSDEDEMLPSAIEIVVETGQASTSMLQRRLKLGYARAARLMDAMEEKGIIGPFEGSKPRQVLITKERWIEMKMVAAAKAEDDRRNY
ncbi:MAG: DNA translocase FtsK [Negativibacillus sp.]